MNEEPRIVVNVTISRAYVEEVEAWVARITELGITAYGQDREAATDIAKEMLAERVAVHRRHGNLREWLGRFSIEWDWAGDYSGPYEEVSTLTDARDYALVA